MVEELQVPIHLKMTLTIKEAAANSNIGINKIESIDDLGRVVNQGAVRPFAPVRWNPPHDFESGSLKITTRPRSSPHL